jgi:Cof subfamily protein (haloacid dehalogenase superfamily)
MEYPYIASDLDGTISRHEDFEILAVTKKDIIDFQKRSNNKFTIATGRNYQLTKRYLDELLIQIPIVTVNGAAVVDPKTEEVIYHAPFPLEKMLELIDYSIENDVDFSVHTPLTIIGRKNNERFQAYYSFSKNWEREEQPNLVEYDDLHDLRNDVASGKHLALKLTASFPLEKRAEADAFNELCVKEGFYHPETIMQGRILIDVLDGEINKGVGVYHLAKYLGIPANEIVTFGDNKNDIEMTNQATIGVAVGNCVPDLKKIAKKIADTIDNNGVGKFIRENF